MDKVGIEGLKTWLERMESKIDALGDKVGQNNTFAREELAGLKSRVGYLEKDLNAMYAWKRHYVEMMGEVDIGRRRTTDTVARWQWWLAIAGAAFLGAVIKHMAGTV